MDTGYQELTSDCSYNFCDKLPHQLHLVPDCADALEYYSGVKKDTVTIESDFNQFVMAFNCRFIKVFILQWPIFFDSTICSVGSCRFLVTPYSVLIVCDYI